METKRLLRGKNVAAAIVAAAISWSCFFCGLSAIGFAGPDEPRYAWIARSMAQTGDWVTPMLYGKPWFEKPVLYYWLAAAGFKFLHSPEWAARLPSSLAALIAVLAMAWLAWRHYGARTAFAALIILPTCAGVIGFSRAAAPDMLFAASLALALVCAATVAGLSRTATDIPERRGSRDRKALVFLGVWLGVATLAKGPAAIVLAGGSVALWALITRKWRPALRMLHPFAVASFAVVALPWYILCGLRNPDFFQVFILQHNFGRYLTPEFHHTQPFWFFVPVILAGLLPWTALLVGVAFDGNRIRRDGSFQNSLGPFVSCWTFFPLLFFSFSQSKLPGYILPAIPPLALLLARSFVRACENTRKLAPSLGVATGVLCFCIAAAAPRLIHRLPANTLTTGEAHALATRILWFGIVFGAVIIALSVARKLFLALLANAAFVAGMTIFATRAILPKVDPYISSRELARIVPQPLPASPREVPLIGVNRSCEFGIRFYRPDLVFTEWNSPSAASPANPFNGYALVGPQGEDLLSRMPFEERHFVRGYTPGCWIEFLHAATFTR